MFAFYTDQRADKYGYDLYYLIYRHYYTLGDLDQFYDYPEYQHRDERHQHRYKRHAEYVFKDGLVYFDFFFESLYNEFERKIGGNHETHRNRCEKDLDPHP